MTTLKIIHFNLQQIADSGQCFRMNQLSENTYCVISCGRFLTISGEDDLFQFYCPEADFPFWQQYFDLNTNYGELIASIAKEDSFLQQAALAGDGIRILYQDPWEMIITFILSQQKTIPKIKEAVEALCRSYGTEKSVPQTDISYYTFPTPSQLAAASLEDLRALKLGYRAKYIERVSRDCADGRLDLTYLGGLDYGEAMKYLTQFYGIGTKVANCICLFGLHCIDAFPVDTWIEQILNKYYYEKKYEALPKSRRYPAMIEDHFGRYRGYAGVMQQYIFYYERVVVNGKG